MEVIGIYKEESQVTFACLSEVKGEVSIEFLETEKKTLSLIKDPYLVSGVEGQDLLIRHLKTPLKQRRDLQKTLPFQLEALIPYKLDEVVVKPIYIPQEGETEALFFTVSKKNLRKHIESFEKENLNPHWVTGTPMALFRFASFVCPQVSRVVVFHIGASKIQLISVEGKRVRNHLTLHMGAEDFKVGKNQKVIEKLRREVDRAFCFLAHKEEFREEREVLFCGQMAEEVETLLQDDSERPLKVVSGTGVGNFSWKEVRRFAIPVGLALDVIKRDRMSIQFRQGEFAAHHGIHRIKSKLIQAVALAAVFCFLIAGGSHLYFQKQEKALIQQIGTLSQSYPEILPHLQGGSLKQVLEDFRSLGKKKVKKDNYFATPPRVSDVLAFLSTHPLLEGIEITRVEYELKKHPTLKASQESYCPRVRLLFSSSEAQKARAFHDAIVENETFVDGNGRVGWNRNEDNYEITFFLRT